jgi:hypothetical protein
MASDNIFRGLAKAGQINCDPSGYFGDTLLAMPEYTLWLAVIDLAILDFLQHGTEKKSYGSYRIYDFFFNNTAEPNNLKFICENIFDYPDAVNVIRKRLLSLAELKKTRALDLQGHYSYPRAKTIRRVRKK